MIYLNIFSVFLLLLSDYLSANERQQMESVYNSSNVRYPISVFWGDTHLHTNMSQDSYVDGNKSLGLDDAYRFAMGETVISNTSLRVQLNRPLDFLIVADHASNMGVLRALDNNDKALLPYNSVLKSWKWHLDAIVQYFKEDKKKAVVLREQLFSELFSDKVLSGSIAGEKFQSTVWQEVINTAENYNQKGVFTTFISYEWTPNIFNLHRVIIFKDGKEKTKKVLPFTQYQSKDPQKLWEYMAFYEKETGGDVLAIPHNGNLSRGIMFALRDFAGNEFSQEYAETRQRWEPLFEITQIKGDSETHPSLSNDQFADFERLSWPEGYNDSSKSPFYKWIIRNEAVAKSDEWEHQFEYARPALKLGLLEKNRLGVNPFKFGFVGGTDSHTSLATADEFNFFGKKTPLEPYATRILDSWRGDIGAESELNSIYKLGWLRSAWTMNAAGYTGIWAEENTRESLFAAMKRKEVYATTGPRITVRFFGGWGYEANDAFRPDLARIGYEKGVPMGGDLTAAPKGKSPKFLIRSVKDPEGANLDRVQVIKGWLDAKGKLHEKIYNVALSDIRTDKGPKTRPVGNTVDVPDASYTNTIGDPELAVVWEDPDFDAKELAFYYVRALEIPTPRWTAYDAKYFGLSDIPEEIPMITQERAYTSPIWYTPVTENIRK